MKAQNHFIIGRHLLNYSRFIHLRDIMDIMLHPGKDIRTYAIGMKWSTYFIYLIFMTCRDIFRFYFYGNIFANFIQSMWFEPCFIYLTPKRPKMKQFSCQLRCSLSTGTNFIHIRNVSFEIMSSKNRVEFKDLN